MAENSPLLKVRTAFRESMNRISGVNKGTIARNRGQRHLPVCLRRRKRGAPDRERPVYSNYVLFDRKEIHEDVLDTILYDGIIQSGIVGNNPYRHTIFDAKKPYMVNNSICLGLGSRKSFHLSFMEVLRMKKRRFIFYYPTVQMTTKVLKWGLTAFKQILQCAKKQHYPTH